MTAGISEWRDYKGGQTYTTQVAIIGTGCGGATLAKRLSEFGLDVILLEQGGYYDQSKMDQNELNMAGKLYGERGLATSHDAGNVLMYGNNVGGASVHYWADSYRTPPEKLAHWQTHYGIAGHSEADLQSAFEQIESDLNIHPAGDAYFNTMNQRLRDASLALGWHGHRVPQARKYCQKSGHCMQGCLYDAKQSQLVTHIPKALSQGARLFADARAVELLRSHSHIEGLKVAIMDRPRNRPSGAFFTIRADAVVVAAGGFNSSVFLMQQAGMQASHPMLGRHFSMNPSTMVHALFDDDIVQWRNIPAAWGVDEFRLRRETQGRYQEGGYLLMPNQLHPAALAAVMPGIGRRHQEWMTQMSRVGGTIAWMDDIEDELGMIELASRGQRRVVYDYGPLTRQVLLDSIRKQVEINFAAGANKVMIAGHQAIELAHPGHMDRLASLQISAGGLFMASPHPGGGCRMGRSTDDSVVDSSHRVHGYDNLFVSDSSVFPTSTSLDPSLTIMAFSYIAAEHIRQSIT